MKLLPNLENTVLTWLAADAVAYRWRTVVVAAESTIGQVEVTWIGREEDGSPPVTILHFQVAKMDLHLKVAVEASPWEHNAEQKDLVPWCTLVAQKVDIDEASTLSDPPHPNRYYRSFVSSFPFSCYHLDDAPVAPVLQQRILIISAETSR